MNKNKPPISAAAATTPTTAPAAMAALFVPPDLAEAEAEVEEGPAVTMTVSPPTVTTDGFADVVDEGVDVALVDVADPDDTWAPMFVFVPIL